MVPYCYLFLLSVFIFWFSYYDTFILDFEKAFDTSTHELLKSKLFSYGTGGKTLKWIDSFFASENNELL